jgi:hypothetical protein
LVLIVNTLMMHKGSDILGDTLLRFYSPFVSTQGEGGTASHIFRLSKNEARAVRGILNKRLGSRLKLTQFLLENLHVELYTVFV